jgi:hypothetical protein
MTGAVHVHVNDYVNVHVDVNVVVDVDGFACGQTAPQTSVYSLSVLRN